MTAPFVDRRDVLKLGGAAALMLLWPPARAEALRPSSLATSTIVLADRRYAESLLFAESLARQGARVVPLASGAGGAWFDAIAPQLPDGLKALAGLTLDSDLFILERLAEGSGARTCYTGAHDCRSRKSTTHTLSGTIDLDPLATCLDNGKENWTGRLGEALLAAKEECRNEQKLEIEYAIPSGQGPRYFVSWLMRWTA